MLIDPGRDLRSDPMQDYRRIGADFGPVARTKCGLGGLGNVSCGTSQESHIKVYQIKDMHFVLSE